MSHRPVLLIGAGLGTLALLGLAATTATNIAENATMRTMRLGTYFTLGEFMRSTVAQRLGIANAPNDTQIHNMRMLVTMVLDPLRAHLGRPVRVTSGFRADAVNAAMPAAAKDSQHKYGEAADIAVDGLTAVQLAEVIHKLGLPVDQCIWYDPKRGGHVHVSYASRWPNRGQYLHAPDSGGYVAWTFTATV